MKLYLISILFFGLSINSFAQVFSQSDFSKYIGPPDVELQEPLIPRSRSLFASISTGLSSQRDFTTNFEFGIWGITKATSYSLTLDAIKNIDSSSTFSYWLGIKPYYTFFDNSRVSYMLYFAPKIKINNGFDFLIENGLSMNYVLNDNLILGTGLAFQSGKDYTFVPDISIGLVVLLQSSNYNPVHKHKSFSHHKLK